MIAMNGNNDPVKMLKSVRAFLSSLTAQLNRRKEEIQELEKKIDNTMEKVREWGSAITSFLETTNAENIDKQSTKRWENWDTVKKSLDIYLFATESEQKQMIEKTLYAFSKQLERGIVELSDVKEYIERLFTVPGYKNELIKEVVEKANKAFFGGKLQIDG